METVTLNYEIVDQLLVLDGNTLYSLTKGKLMIKELIKTDATRY